MSTVGWGSFSVRLGFHGVFGSWLSGPLSHLLVVFIYCTGLGFSVGQGPRVLAWGWRDGL